MKKKSSQFIYLKKNFAKIDPSANTKKNETFLIKKKFSSY